MNFNISFRRQIKYNYETTIIIALGNCTKEKCMRKHTTIGDVRVCVLFSYSKYNNECVCIVPIIMSAMAIRGCTVPRIYLSFSSVHFSE